jgi:ribosome-associated heat shock protein Hsp15
MIEEGNVRLIWGGDEICLNKPSRALRSGDVLIFFLGERRFAVRVEALGERRGPATEARTLYCILENGAPSVCEDPGGSPAHPSS